MLHTVTTTSTEPTAHYQPNKDSLGWYYPSHTPHQPAFQTWDLSSPDIDIKLRASTRSLIPNKSASRAASSRVNTSTSTTSTSVNQPTNTTSNIVMPVPARSSTTENSANPAAQRWRYNNNGQFVDMGAESASWELADEIGRLKIGDVTGTDTDDARLPLRTPPKSKLPSATVAQITESSPLDSSSNSSSPHVSDHPVSHSRGSSADTTLSSTRDASVAGNALLARPPIKAAPPAEAKERPHSFSGGLSTADLRRLQQTDDGDHDRQLQAQQQQQQQQQQQWYRDSEQMSYPSLANQVHRPVPQHQQQQAFNYPPNASSHQSNDRDREEAQQMEYNAQHQQQQQQQQQRNYGGVPPHLNPGMLMNPMNPGTPPSFPQARPTNAIPPMSYRPTPRTFAPQAPTNAALGYGGGGAPHHTPHLSLGNTQQLYEMMLPGPPLADSHHPAVQRVQQQHNVFRATHHHSASDPSAAMRDVNAQLALLNAQAQAQGFVGVNVGVGGGGPQTMFQPAPLQPPGPPPQMYAGQYYSAATVQDLAAAAVQQQVMAARLQQQYTGGYGAEGIGSPTSSSGQTGPSANNRKLGLYKTELCRSWEEKGTCRYGAKCQFAHGEDELRKVSRHPKYKTEICKTFWVSGSCPYGKRCCFIHTELTTPGTASTTESTPPPSQLDGSRGRSNSDPDASSSISILARIQRSAQTQQNQAQAQQEAQTPIDMISTNGFQFTKPPTGSLRVDTSVSADGNSLKQNKSAYPSFASNGILLPAAEHVASRKSPVPATAGPDLGRHNLARMEIVGYANHQKKNSTSSASNSNPRHSFSGDADLGFSADASSQPGGSASSSGTVNAPQPTRAHGHVRSGSAGNWGSFGRSSHLSTSTTSAAYQNGVSGGAGGGNGNGNVASPVGEIMSASPWSSTELAVGTSRLHEKAWA